MPAKKKKAKAPAKKGKGAKGGDQPQKPKKPKIDPTFGLKNKKGSKHRQFVKNAKANMGAKDIAADKKRREKKKKREAAEAMQNFENDLYRTVDGGTLAKQRVTSKGVRKMKKTEDQKKEKQKEEEEDPEPTELEECLDWLRRKLEGRTDLTPVTAESFEAWHTAWRAAQAAAALTKARAKASKKGSKNKLTGKELFMLDSSQFVDDAEAEDEYVFEKEEDGGAAEDGAQPVASADRDAPEHKEAAAGDGGGGGAGDGGAAAPAAVDGVDESLFMDDIDFIE